MFASIFIHELYSCPKYRYGYNPPRKFPISDQLCRLFRLSYSVIPPILTYPLPKMVYYRSIYNFFANNGYVVMKIGQWLATRSDLLPIGLCKVLNTLHSEAPVHPFADTLKILEDEMYDTSLFHFVNHSPIGSGSVAQVYKVILNDEPRNFSPFFQRFFLNFIQIFVPTRMGSTDIRLEATKKRMARIKKSGNRTFAIKVIHPNTIRDVYLDCQIITNIASIIGRIPAFSCLNVNEQALHFQNEIFKQIDLTEEERNMKVMRHLIHYDENVLVAEPITATKNVLIMEYLEGYPITSHFLSTQNEAEKNYCIRTAGVFQRSVKNLSDKLSKISLSGGNNAVSGPLQQEKFSLATTALSFFVKSLFYNRFIHTDLHPGNVAISKSNKLIIYDLGLTKLLSDVEYTNFVDLFCSLFIERNGLVVGDLLVERLACNKGVDKKEFRVEINELISHYFEQVYNIKECENMNEKYALTKEYAFKAVRLFNKYNVKIDYKYNHLFLTAFCFDGILRQLQPDGAFYNDLSRLLWKFGPTTYLLRRYILSKKL